MFNGFRIDGAGPIGERPVAGTKGLRHGYHWMDEDGSVTLYTGTKWVTTSVDSLISYHWAGAGTTSAPDPSAFSDYVIGVNGGGATTGNVYHVIDGAWVDTGATVANLYGA